jgi:hypothetical protein
MAPISNLPYRRIDFGRAPADAETSEFSKSGALEIRDTAG